MLKKSAAETTDRDVRLQALLAFEGRLSRGRLIEVLDLSDTRASEVLREFRVSYPEWTLWDSKARCWRATTLARNKLSTPATAEDLFARYVTLTRISRSRPDSEPSTLCSVYSVVSAPDPRVFAPLQEAIEGRRPVTMIYRSMTHPEPHERYIVPHTLVRAGRRWHVRAFCLDRRDFRDFALGRISRVSAHKPSSRTAVPSADPTQDAAWQAAVTVVLVAHPALSQAQQEVIRTEYFSSTSGRREICRGALVSYMIQDLRAAVDVHKQLPPDYQMAVENIKEVRPWLFPAP